MQHRWFLSLLAVSLVVNVVLVLAPTREDVGGVVGTGAVPRSASNSDAGSAGLKVGAAAPAEQGLAGSRQQDYLVTALRDERDAEALVAGLEQLAWSRHFAPESRPWLRGLLTGHPEPRVRQAAALALGATGAPVSSLVQEVLSAPDAATRALWLDALRVALRQAPGFASPPQLDEADVARLLALEGRIGARTGLIQALIPVLGNGAVGRVLTRYAPQEPDAELRRRLQQMAHLAADGRLVGSREALDLLYTR